MRVNLLKRMESSINSFALTVKKLLDRNETLIALLEKQSDGFVEDMSIMDVDIESEEYASQNSLYVPIHPSNMFYLIDEKSTIKSMIFK